EKDRQTRMINALTGAALSLFKKPYWEALGRDKGGRDRGDSFAAIAQLYGLGEQEGPGKELNPEQWGRLLDRAGWVGVATPVRLPFVFTARNRCQLCAAQLQVALALFQVQKGRPAA